MPDIKCVSCGKAIEGDRAKGGRHLELRPGDDGDENVTNWVCFECLANAEVTTHQ